MLTRLAVRQRKNGSLPATLPVNRCSTGRELRYTHRVKGYIQARLGDEDQAVLDELKRSTGLTESQIVRRGLQLVAEEAGRPRSALDLAGRSVGRFEKGPRDLSANRKHL